MVFKKLCFCANSLKLQFELFVLTDQNVGCAFETNILQFLAEICVCFLKLLNTSYHSKMRYNGLFTLDDTDNDTDTETNNNNYGFHCYAEHFTLHRDPVLDAIGQF